MDRTTAQKLIAQGYVAIVYVAYGYGDKQRGDVISKHKSYEAADRKAKGYGMWGIRMLSEIV